MSGNLSVVRDSHLMTLRTDKKKFLIEKDLCISSMVRLQKVIETFLIFVILHVPETGKTD